MGFSGNEYMYLPMNINIRQRDYTSSIDRAYWYFSTRRFAINLRNLSPNYFYFLPLQNTTLYYHMPTILDVLTGLERSSLHDKMNVGGENTAYKVKGEK